MGKKIQYSIWKKETNSAGGKAKNDAFDIAYELGFVPSYLPSNYRCIRILQQMISISKIRREDILFVQYPTISKPLQDVFFKKIKKNSITIALIHDLSSIQGLELTDVRQEIEQLKHFSHLIVHNKRMGDYIKNLGYKGSVVELELFDYLHDANKRVKTNSYSNSISIAGNLKKAQYIMDLEKITSCQFQLYGIKGEFDFSGLKNVEYKGMLSSDEIVYQMAGDYGLIWDGDSIECCSGIFGEYLRYNNPHKLSLCMAAEKPVIVWKKSAVSDFVKKERIGICIDSLEELNAMDLHENYCIMKQNVKRIKQNVADGFYLKRALNSIISDK